MKKKSAKDDGDNPQWTKQDFKRSISLEEALPELHAQWKRARGRPRKAVTAKAISLRLEPEVEHFFRATGKGWQTRLNQALREWIDQRPS